MCLCGCGAPAPLAKVTRADRGWIKGEPKQFVRGHDKRGFVVSEKTRAKISASTKGKPHPKGPAAPGWKGGTKILKGRLMVHVGLEHPMTRTQVYVMEHRLVAASALGRPLESHEHVHHIDLNETNNAVENLSVLSNSQHQRLHRMVEAGADPLVALRDVGGVRITDTTPRPVPQSQDET